MHSVRHGLAVWFEKRMEKKEPGPSALPPGVKAFVVVLTPRGPGHGDFENVEGTN